MAPALTCLDQVAVRTPTAEEQITVGDVVSFPMRVCIPFTAPRHIEHRVVAVRAGEDGTEYLTKGDANLEPDCWVPFHLIKHVVVDVRKDVFPANGPLYVAVRVVWAAHREAMVAYLDDVEALCGHRDPALCSPPASPAYDEMVRKWQRAEATHADLECWVQKAQLSQYPGHIPRDVCTIPPQSRKAP